MAFHFGSQTHFSHQTAYSVRPYRRLVAGQTGFNQGPNVCRCACLFGKLTWLSGLLPLAAHLPSPCWPVNKQMAPSTAIPHGCCAAVSRVRRSRETGLQVQLSTPHPASARATAACRMRSAGTAKPDGLRAIVQPSTLTGPVDVAQVVVVAKEKFVSVRRSWVGAGEQLARRQPRQRSCSRLSRQSSRLGRRLPKRMGKGKKCPFWGCAAQRSTVNLRPTPTPCLHLPSYCPRCKPSSQQSKGLKAALPHPTTMEEAPSKHRNLQHLLSEGVKERAFQMLGYGSEAGLKVLELRWVLLPPAAAGALFGSKRHAKHWKYWSLACSVHRHVRWELACWWCCGTLCCWCGDLEARQRLPNHAAV